MSKLWVKSCSNSDRLLFSVELKPTSIPFEELGTYDVLSRKVFLIANTIPEQPELEVLNTTGFNYTVLDFTLGWI